jgi:hypothetical protein
MKIATNLSHGSVGNVHGQEIWTEIENRTLAKYDTALNDILRFADVSWPGIVD